MYAAIISIIILEDTRIEFAKRDPCSSPIDSHAITNAISYLYRSGPGFIPDVDFPAVDKTNETTVK